MSLSLPVVVLILLLLFIGSVRVLKEYERGVMFTLGRFTGVKGPGVRLVLPVIQQMKKVELRTVVLNVPKQDVISRDNVSVKVSAVVYFRIVDPEKAILAGNQPMGSDQSACADHLAFGGWAARNGRNAGAARQAQCGYSAHP